MLKFCRDKWQENKDKLEQALRNDSNINDCDYTTLVQMVVKHILNEPTGTNAYPDKFDPDCITEIDDGDYQGTLIFLIPRKTYQPGCSDYLMTYVYYGSCSGCDTLQGIQNYQGGAATEEQIKDYMQLCLDIVCHFTKPYNDGWHADSKYDEIAEW